MLKPIRSIIVLPNLSIAVFDEHGEQIPELQKSLPSLFAEHAALLGYDVDGKVFETRDGNWRFFKTSEGEWNRERA